jgi:acetyl-CoA carboxylase biotin carboxyl carrier protein
MLGRNPQIATFWHALCSAFAGSSRRVICGSRGAGVAGAIARSGGPPRAGGEPRRAGGLCWPPSFAVDLRECQLPDVEAHITGTVWKIEVEVGDTVEEGDTVVILESMKMEMPVEAEDSGVVSEIRCTEGQAVSEGDVLVVLE